MEILSRDEWVAAGRPANTVFCLEYRPEKMIAIRNKEVALNEIDELNKQTRKFMFAVHKQLEKYGAILWDMPGIYEVAQRYLNVNRLFHGVYCIWASSKKVDPDKWLAVSYVAYMIVEVHENGQEEG